MNAKPTLESRLLYLQDKDGKPLNNYCILLDATGRQYGRLFDLSREGERDYLAREFIACYETEGERRARWDALSAARELTKFEKAEKINSKDYHGGVFFNDTYYYDTGDVYEDLERDDEESMPLYAWAEKLITLKRIDARNIMGRIEESLFAEGDISFNGKAELDKALDAFYTLNDSKLKCFEPDYTRAIILDKAVERT